MVVQMQESTAFCTQLVIANDADASTWRRSYRDGTWTAWEKLVKLKSITFTSGVTSISDFYNFMMDNIDSVKEVVIIPNADITGRETTLIITSSETVFNNSSNETALHENYEYRFNQISKIDDEIRLKGEGFTGHRGEYHIYAIVNSLLTFECFSTTSTLEVTSYSINQIRTSVNLPPNLTFKVYYFDYLNLFAFANKNYVHRHPAEKKPNVHKFY